MTWSFTRLPDLSEEEFAEWQALLEQRTGITFDRHKRILQTGLTRRMQEIECPSYRNYYRKVCFDKGAALEWSALLRTLTVKETRFFRDDDAFNLVKDHIYTLCANENHNDSLEIWSVACSTGEEAYSLAMLVNDIVKETPVEKFYGVTATDICLASLAVARKGIYTSRKLDFLDPALVGRYFDKEGKQGRAIAAWLKRRMCFAQANLIELENLPINDMDVIYCQNVLIYFKGWRRKQVLNDLVSRLKPGGLLVVGMGEALDWSNHKVQRVKSELVHAYTKII